MKSELRSNPFVPMSSKQSSATNSSKVPFSPDLKASVVSQWSSQSKFHQPPKQLSLTPKSQVASKKIGGYSDPKYCLKVFERN